MHTVENIFFNVISLLVACLEAQLNVVSVLEQQKHPGNLQREHNTNVESLCLLIFGE